MNNTIKKSELRQLVKEVMKEEMIGKRKFDVTKDRVIVFARDLKDAEEIVEWLKNIKYPLYPKINTNKKISVEIHTYGLIMYALNNLL